MNFTINKICIYFTQPHFIFHAYLFNEITNILNELNQYKKYTKMLKFINNNITLCKNAVRMGFFGYNTNINLLKLTISAYQCYKNNVFM